MTSHARVLLGFAKYQGLGNDFVIVDGRASGRMPGPHAAIRLCSRRRGIGGDGVLSLLPSRDPKASVRMHVTNADGSVAEMCGNGLRCVIQYLAERAALSGVQWVDTDAGLRSGQRLDTGLVRADAGRARLLASDVQVDLGDRTITAVAISVGNPHLVLPPFPREADLRSLAVAHGPALERHPFFPNRCNVSFSSVREDGVIRLVVFERGSGITEACGTGASATAAAARAKGWVRGGGEMAVELPGGVLRIELSDGAGAGEGELGQISMTGEASFVFEGRAPVDEDEMIRAPGGH